jgi:transcription-repair coupling factor (superfamily II helicase)
MLATAGRPPLTAFIPTPVVSLLQLMELKLLARRCGFSRIRPEKPNIALETPMEEPAFRLLPPAEQVEQLKEGLAAMAGQLPDADGLTEAQRQERQKAKDEAVLVVWHRC